MRGGGGQGGVEYEAVEGRGRTTMRQEWGGISCCGSVHVGLRRDKVLGWKEGLIGLVE